MVPCYDPTYEKDPVRDGLGDGLGDPRFYFLCRLTMASVAMPSMRPAIIDSHGKPGIAGRDTGVEIETVV